LPISTPLTFAFIGENLVLTKKKNGWWDILGGKLKEGETWIEGLERETLEEAGIVIGHISVIGYIMTNNSGDLTNLKFAPKNILPVTISFVQEVKKEWLKYETLGREHFGRKLAKKALLDRGDNGQLAEIFDYVLSCYDNQKYDYSFEYVEGNTFLTNIPNTQSMVFVRTPAKKFLIVRDFDEKFFSLPGGGCNMNEDGKECAIREVKEEAQVEVKNVQLIGNVIVKVNKNGQVFSVSTQQRYLADAFDVYDFIANPDNLNKEDYETVERKEVPFESLSEEVKLLKNKTGEAILSSLKRIL
jgi:ADP-ribose pyrophosphatase YjhB (NUDIX family)